MTKDDEPKAPAPPDFAEPDLAPVYATLPPHLQARFHKDFAVATRETALSLFNKIDAAIYLWEAAEDRPNSCERDLRPAPGEEAGRRNRPAVRRPEPRRR